MTWEKSLMKILGLGQDEIDADLLGDMGSLLNGGIADLGEKSWRHKEET